MPNLADRAGFHDFAFDFTQGRWLARAAGNDEFEKRGLSEPATERPARMTASHRCDAIAVVDDDPRLRQLVGGYLSQEGYEVFEAENGSALSSIL